MFWSSLYNYTGAEICFINSLYSMIIWLFMPFN
uniref:Uncharacterized protein n=1 Tax=Anguilla anguilla TaxID=7936 RepID=A0A0E9R3L7_ANGAN